MKLAERKEKVRQLINVRECLEFLKERLEASPPEYKAVIEKNIDLTKQKERKLCKQIGYGDLTNSSTTSQHLRGKA
jgi:hypothetical protein